jgi:molecular chaperone DnaK (HSP70)
MAKTVGIDLGTTNSVVVMEEGSQLSLLMQQLAYGLPTSGGKRTG